MGLKLQGSFHVQKADANHSLTNDTQDDDHVSIHDWKPSFSKGWIIQSDWRKRKIGNDFNQQPGFDDLQKIERYIRKKYPDSEIMQSFGISAETLTAIKGKRYCPIEGISNDNLSKIHEKFKKVQANIVALQRAVYCLGYRKNGLEIFESESHENTLDLDKRVFNGNKNINKVDNED